MVLYLTNFAEHSRSVQTQPKQQGSAQEHISPENLPAVPNPMEVTDQIQSQIYNHVEVPSPFCQN